MKHENWLGYAKAGKGNLYNKDSTFKVHQDGQYVQFESVNFPNHYMRHANFRFRLSKNDGSELFKEDSKFTPQEMPCDGSGSIVQLRSLLNSAIKQNLPATVSAQDLASGKSPIEIG